MASISETGDFIVTGIGIEPIEVRLPSLKEAAYMADKMKDNGVKDVVVTAPDGTRIPRTIWFSQLRR